MLHSVIVTPHWQVVFVAVSIKPYFFSSVLVLTTPVRRRLRYSHIVHPEFDPGDSLSSGVMFKRVLCGSALSFRLQASSLQIEIFSFRGSTQFRKLLLDFNLDGAGWCLNNI